MMVSLPTFMACAALFLYSSQVYAKLLDVSKIQIKNIGSYGKSLVVRDGLKRGETIVTVPGELCLLANRNGGINGLLGQTDLTLEVCGDLRVDVSADDLENRGRTWDVQLALALLDATSGSNCAPPLWDKVAESLPSPHLVTLPLCMSKVALRELQRPDITAGAMRQKQRLYSLFPVLARHDAHPSTIMAANRLYKELTSMGIPVDAETFTKFIPTPLEWAFAMVRSRCFMPSSDTFAIVPIIDMANHEETNPNARYIWHPEEEYFSLVAQKDFLPGQEVTITYDKGFANDRLLVQYGFHIPGNEFDQLWRGVEVVTEEEERDMLRSPMAELIVQTALATITDDDADDSTPAREMPEEEEDNAVLRQRQFAVSNTLCRRVNDVYRDQVLQAVETATGATAASDDSSSVMDKMAPLLLPVAMALQQDVQQLQEHHTTTLQNDIALLKNVESIQSIDPYSMTIVVQDDGRSVDRIANVLNSTSTDMAGVNIHQYKEALQSRIERKKMIAGASKVVDKIVTQLSSSQYATIN